MNNQTSLNFYTIKSDFNEILIRLCDKILNSSEKIYVNFHNEDQKKEGDRMLWIKQKNNFVPHKVLGEKISTRDKIILFSGQYSKIPVIETFKSIIISPQVKINKFYLFRKFFIFSYINEVKFNSVIKNKLTAQGFDIKWYDECSPLKWKLR